MAAPVSSSLLDVKPNLLHADVTLHHSELFRADCRRLIQQSDKARKRMQDEASNGLCQRVKDIEFVKKELELKLEDVTVEIEALIALQSRVGKALEGTKEPLRVSVLCMEERMKRFPTERLVDAVDAALRKEQSIVEGVASLLQRVEEQITEQIRLNRSAKYHLEQDLKEKFEAGSIDNSCAIMTTHSISNLQPQNTDNALLSLFVTPKQWENISDINIAKAEQQRVNSQSLLALVESVLEQTAVDTQNQFEATKTAFQIHIQDIKSVKSQMEEGVSKLLLEISDQQRIREDLQVLISKNEDALSLVRAQLALRSHRPGKEKCFDLPQSQLLAEVQQLSAHIGRMREEISNSEKEQRALIRCQLRLQENIEAKANSLYIDEVICSQHREPVVIHKF